MVVRRMPKKMKNNCLVAFLDDSRAFDRIGHSHIENSLTAKGVSRDLQGLIVALL